jgi:protocatechuate 3,4-dioxygenase beta subunit
VTAIAADGARGAVAATIPVEGARVEANPVLPTGTEALRGRVVHSDGRPWTGLVVVEPAVEMWDLLTMDLAAPPVPVDGDGRFEAGGLSAGVVTVSALEPGLFRASSGPVAVPHDGEFVFVVDAAVRTLSGRVVADADGTPVAGAKVIGVAEGGSDFALSLRSSTSAPDGTFRVDVAGRGRPSLLVSAEGFATAWSQPTAGSIEVRLARAARLVGRVTSATDGTPVPGLVVRASSLSGAFAGAPAPTKTAADGRYEIGDLAAGEAMAYAEGDGWTTEGRPDSTSGAQGYNPLAVVLEAGTTTTLDLVVARGVRVTGRVLASDGTGVAGAVVRAAPGTDRSRAGTLSTRYAPVGGPVAASGPDGAFALDGLTTGVSYVFGATAAERAAATAGPLSASPATEVELRFGGVRWVDVTVLEEATGAPLGGVGVTASIQMTPNSWRGDGTRAVTDGEGRVRLGPFPADPLRLHVSGPGFVQMQGPVLPPTESAATLRVRRSRAIAGRVVLPDGSPVADATVRAQPADASGGWWGSATTDATGAFRVEQLDDATYAVRAVVEHEGRVLEATARATGGGEEVVLRLAASGGRSTSVTVRVVDGDGRPVPRASYNVSAGGGSSGGGLTDGLATVDVGSAGGEVTVAVWGARRADGAALPLAPYREEHPPGTALVVARLQPEAAVAGRVIDPEGRGIRGALVTADWPSGQSNFTNVATARTGDDGSFRLGGLSAEDYVLRAQLPPHLAPADPVPVRGGASGVEIRARAGLRPTITLLDWRGLPVTGARVSASEPRRPGTPRPPRYFAPPATDANGTVRLDGLDPGVRYELRVQRPQDRIDVANLNVPSWSPRDETFRLERVWFVRGVVRDLAGQPVAEAYVTPTKGERRGHSAQTDATGQFTILDLPAGDVTLVVAARFQGHEEAPPDGRRRVEVVVPAGTDDLVVTIDVGPTLVVLVDGLSNAAWGQALLYAEGPQARMVSETIQQGRARFLSLDADATYTLFVGPFGDRSALVRGVRVGGEVHVRPVPGKSITGRLSLPEGVDSPSVQAQLEGRVNVQGVVRPDKTYEIVGLPDGTWKVNANAHVEGKWWNAEGEVPAGGTLDLHLKAR